MNEYNNHSEGNKLGYFLQRSMNKRACNSDDFDCVCQDLEKYRLEEEQHKDRGDEQHLSFSQTDKEDKEKS